MRPPNPFSGNPGRGHVDTSVLRVSAANDVTAVRGYTQKYSYDRVGNLLQMRHQLGAAHSASAWTRRYAYSEHGNRLRATAIGNTPSPDLYPHDELGRITAMPHLDALAFDAFDQLDRVQVGTTVVRFQYADGVRVRKWVEKGGLTEERVYVGGVEAFSKFTGSDPTTDAPKERTFTQHFPGGLTLDTKTFKDSKSVAKPRPLFRHQLGNHLGSTSLEVDEDGAVVSYEEYHPYGSTAYRAVRGDVDVDVNRYRFTGMERDDETGLAQHGARYYVSWLGRWCSSDPIGLGDGVNRYAYCRGDPVGFTDVGGHARLSSSGTPHEVASRFLDAAECVEPGGAAEMELAGELSGLPDEQRREVLDALARRSGTEQFDVGEAPYDGPSMSPALSREEYERLAEERRLNGQLFFLGMNGPAALIFGVWAAFQKIGHEYQVPVPGGRLSRDQAFIVAGVGGAGIEFAGGMAAPRAAAPARPAPAVQASRPGGHRSAGAMAAERPPPRARTWTPSQSLSVDTVRSLGRPTTRAAAGGGGLARGGNGRATFQGLEVRGMRDLSHVPDSTLRAQAKLGFAARDARGRTMVLHHHRQNPAGPIIEIPGSKHSIGNANQHPFDNTKGMGLSADQRVEFNAWRVDYWKARAQGS